MADICEKKKKRTMVIWSGYRGEDERVEYFYFVNTLPHSPKCFILFPKIL